MSWKAIGELRGVISLNDLSEIAEGGGVEENIGSLKEDLLQVVYFDNIILDIGFYPEFDLSGEFVVTIIEDEDWTDPVLAIKFRKLDRLVSITKLAEVFILENYRKGG